MDIVNEYLAESYRELDTEPVIEVRERVRCKDGFSISIQASESHYCSPRRTFKPTEGNVYETVELGFPSMKDMDIWDYAEDCRKLTKTVYSFVPVERVAYLLEKHGGREI